jgi:hypothetical protein
MTAKTTSDAGIAEYVRIRGITEVLHFTTFPPGITGICATGAVLCRDRLSEDKYVEYIYAPNCSNRLKDAAWTGYVNLSISRVNKDMLGTSKGWHQHRDLFWGVLSLDPAILQHPGVTFATTNNTYHGCVRRSTGVDGLSALCAESVEWGYYGSLKRRYVGMPEAWTTDPQAEVLYPDQVDLQHLTAIYVNEEEQIDDVCSTTRLWRGTESIPVLHKPEIFQ